MTEQIFSCAKCGRKFSGEAIASLRDGEGLECCEGGLKIGPMVSGLIGPSGYERRGGLAGSTINPRA